MNAKKIQIRSLRQRNRYRELNRGVGALEAWALNRTFSDMIQEQMRREFMMVVRSALLGGPKEAR